MIPNHLADIKLKLKLHFIISSSRLLNHIIKVAQCQPIWNQIFYQHPMFSFTLFLPEDLPSQSPRFENIIDSQQTPHPKMFFIDWIYQSQRYTPLQKDSYENTYWLILDEQFYIHVPEYNLFWLHFGNYIISAFNFITKKCQDNQQLKPIVFCSSLFLPNSLSQSIEKEPFDKLEFYASCSIFHTNWLIHTGLWIPVYRGSYLEWIIRGSSLTIKNKHQTLPHIKSAQHMLIKYGFKIPYHFTLPTKIIMSVFIENPPLPLEHPNEWSNWTLNSIKQLYSFDAKDEWTTQKKTDWIHLWNPWDVRPDFNPPKLPKLIEKMFLPSHPYPFTIAITGGNRPEIAARTIQSFIQQWIDINKFSIQFIIHIDGSKFVPNDAYQELLEMFLPSIKSYQVEYIIAKQQKGLAKSFIDLMNRVQTDLVFYLQDDWEFLTPFMMEQIIREIMPFSSLNVAAHLYKTDLGNNNNQLVHMSPCVYKTFFVRHWIYWCQKGEYPLNLLRDWNVFNEKGGFLTKLNVKSVCCSFSGKFKEMVRDIGRPWMLANQVMRNDAIKRESFDRWIWKNESAGDEYKIKNSVINTDKII